MKKSLVILSCLVFIVLTLTGMNSASFASSDISVSPLKLRAKLEPDTTKKRTFTISNVGDADLHYKLKETATWLSLNKTQGTIARGGASRIRATLNSTGLLPGIYRTIIMVKSNDLDEPLIRVRVIMTVIMVELACVERQLLDPGVPVKLAPTDPRVGIDSAGNILAAWGYQFSDPGQLYTARFDVVTGWEPKQLLDTSTVIDSVFLPTLAVNSRGAGLLAWSGQRGIYAAAYLPGSGWQETQTIISGTSLFLTFADEFEQLAIDNAGNGLLVWSQYGDELYGSWYKAGVGWSAPEIIVNRKSIARGISLAMNPDGNAILLWSQGTGIDNQVLLNASHFTPGAGWQPPVVLHTSDSLHTRPHVAINSKGEAMAAWLDYGGSSNFPVYAARFIPGQGWQPPELMSMHSFQPWVDMDTAGNAVVVWTTFDNPTVSARHYLKDSGWQEIKVLKRYQAGDPLNTWVKMDDQGNAVAIWWSPLVPARIDAQRFRPMNVWQEFDVMGGPLKGNAGMDERLAMNANGAASVTWLDTYEVFNGQFFEIFVDIYASRFSILCQTDDRKLQKRVRGSGSPSYFSSISKQ